MRTQQVLGRVVFAIVALSTVASAQSVLPVDGGTIVNPGVFADAFQINYLANPTISTVPGGNVVNISNAGELGSCSFGPSGCLTDVGDICANVYVFQSDEELEECCTCLVTPDALVHLTAADLIGNPGNGVTPTNGVVIKLLATVPSRVKGGIPAGVNNVPGTTFTGNQCNAAQGFTGANLAPGIRAWRTTIHQATAAPTYQITEEAFSPALLSPGELATLNMLCRVIFGNGSGPGQCKSCPASSGALGGTAK
jgi:hypothetical protein